VEPRDYLRLFRRRWWIIAGIALLGATFAWITAPAAKAPNVQRFEATHTLIVEPTSRLYTPENPQTIALLAASGEVPRRVAARLELPEDRAERLLRNVAVTGEPGLGIVEFKASTGTSERSELLANTFAEELVTFLDEQETAAQTRLLDSARNQGTDLQGEIQQVSEQIANGDGDPAVLEQQRLALVARYADVEQRYQALLGAPPASSGLRSLGPAFAVEVDAGIHAPRGRNERALILGTIGLMLALVVVLVLERLDVRIKTKEEAEAAFGLPVIAEIPNLPLARRRERTVISHTEPASGVAEAYRSLRTTLLILEPTPIAPPIAADAMRRRASDMAPAPTPRPAREPRVFLVTSTRPSEGKTFTTVNLAATFAEAGRSVLVIGADVRRPEAHAYLQAARAPGLTEALRSDLRVELEDLIQDTSVPGVRILASGDHVSNPGELLLQGPELIQAARELADVVLVDTTPMLTVNDAIQLMPACDSIIVVSRAGRSTTEAAKRAHEILARLRVPVAGLVLVAAPETPGVASYYYGYQSASSTTVLARGRRALRQLRPGRPGDELPIEPLEPMPDPAADVSEPWSEPRYEPAPEPEARRAAELPVPEPPRPAPPAVERREQPAPANGTRPHAPMPDRGTPDERDPWGWP
jgi:capsular exopolysaccharide synthesis family protein